MKKLSLLLILVPLVGCYTPHQYPLSPGEKIIFKSPERANEFRARSLNDPAHTGSVVEITKPTWVSCE